jgi:hypothetical protein
MSRRNTISADKSLSLSLSPSLSLSLSLSFSFSFSFCLDTEDENLPFDYLLRVKDCNIDFSKTTIFQREKESSDNRKGMRDLDHYFFHFLITS